MANDGDPRPARYQLVDALRGRISSGELAAGDTLPTQPEIAAQHGMSATTVKAALKLLKEEGLVSSRPGVGVYVRGESPRIRISYLHERDEKLRAVEPAAARAQEGAAERNIGRSVYDLEFSAEYERIHADAELAERLAVSEDTEILQRTYVSRDPDSRLVQQWSRSWIPVSYIEHVPALLDQGEEPYPGGTHAQLRAAGLEARRVVSRVTSRGASADELHGWGLMSGSRMLESRNTTYSDDADRPLLAATAVYPADRVELEYCTELPGWQ